VNSSTTIQPVTTGGERDAQISVVAIAASAGGLRALSHVLAALAPDFPAAVVVVLHVDPRYPSHIAEILAQRTCLRMVQAGDGDRLLPGVVYVAPPDRHLLIEAGGVVALTRTALDEYVRPSANRLFESLAASFGAHAIAVVLTGKGHDGAAGVQAIKRMGGVVIVQDQETSQEFGMPGSAIRTGDADFVVPLQAIAPRLDALVRSGGGHAE
jgi:two-component system chemotaxis response regulator CheB